MLLLYISETQNKWSHIKVTSFLIPRSSTKYNSIFWNQKQNWNGMIENLDNKNKFVLLQPRYCNACAIKLNPSQFSGRKDLPCLLAMPATHSLYFFIHFISYILILYMIPQLQKHNIGWLCMKENIYTLKVYLPVSSTRDLGEN